MNVAEVSTEELLERRTELENPLGLSAHEWFDWLYLSPEPDLAPVWGDGDHILWAEGEALMVAAPTGAGKTTIAIQLCRALMGIRDEVLGFPVRPHQKVLYIALDRPKQVRRMMRLFLKPEDAAFAGKLYVHDKPMLNMTPESVSNLALMHGADVVILDSLKDFCPKMTDDESASRFKQTVELCTYHNINVVVLHHNRKGLQTENASPSVDKIFGSVMLTAGMGSVFSIVQVDPYEHTIEIHNVKEIVERVPVMKARHDYEIGETVVMGWDALDYMASERDRGVTSFTVGKLAQSKKGGVVSTSSKEYRSMQRHVDKLVNKGLLVHMPGSPATYSLPNA